MINHKGEMYWYMNTAFGDAWCNNGYGLLIDTGWDKYTHVFGGKDNIVYGVTPDGELHRHDFNKQ